MVRGRRSETGRPARTGTTLPASCTAGPTLALYVNGTLPWAPALTSPVWRARSGLRERTEWWLPCVCYSHSPCRSSRTGRGLQAPGGVQTVLTVLTVLPLSAMWRVSMQRKLRRCHHYHHNQSNSQPATALHVIGLIPPGSDRHCPVYIIINYEETKAQ